MKEVFVNIVIVITVIAVCFGSAFGVWFSAVHLSNKAFNNGICTICESEFHFLNASSGRWTHYFYQCENGHIIDCVKPMYKEETP